MVSRIFRIDHIDGKTTINAGGGSLHKTYEAQTVLKPKPGGYELKSALFIKTSGHLAAKTDQAYIPIEKGDVVINMYGKLPISDLNPDAHIEAYRITDIGLSIADGEKIPVTHKEIPLTVITGAGTYHNRNGGFFCLNPIITTTTEGN